MSEKELAPVVVFAYRRPEATVRLFRSLAANPEAPDSEVHVFIDGPKTPADRLLVTATAAVARSSGFRHLQVTERTENLGLARNIIDGVTRINSEHGRVIVLEDDLILAPTFLRYMNAALTRYAEEPDVFHVSGYMFPVDFKTEHDALFLPFTHPLGWATWQRAWQAFDPEARGFQALQSDRAARARFDLDNSFYFFNVLKAQLEGRVDSWFIRWYLSVFMKGGLGLFPRRSLVEHTGFEPEATHASGGYSRHLRGVANTLTVESFPPVKVDDAALRKIERFLRWDTSRLVGKARSEIRKVGKVLMRLGGE